MEDKTRKRKQGGENKIVGDGHLEYTEFLAGSLQQNDMSDRLVEGVLD